MAPEVLIGDPYNCKVDVFRYARESGWRWPTLPAKQLTLNITLKNTCRYYLWCPRVSLYTSQPYNSKVDVLRHARKPA